MNNTDAFLNFMQEALEDDSPPGLHEPQSALAYISRGYAHLDQANVAGTTAQRLVEFRQALDNWNKAIEIGLHTVPPVMKTVEPAVYYAVSLHLLHASNDFHQVIDDLTRVIEVDLHYVKAYVSRGEAHAKLGAHQDAVDDFTRVIEFGGTDGSIYERRGTAYEKLDRYDSAANDFTAALAQNPERSMNYYSRAKAYRLLGEFNQAIDDYQKVVELASDSGLGKLAADRLNEFPPKRERTKKRENQKTIRQILFRWF